MIPKKIHYCWLSDEPFPKKIRKCMDTWQKTHPEYEIKRWSTKNFDIDSVPYVKEAYQARKWAFAADYIRMYALYTEGGIYLDSDVILLKKFDDFLDNSFFSSMEYHPPLIKMTNSTQYLDDEGHRIKDVPFVSGIEIQAAVMGAEKGNAYVKDVLDYYNTIHFQREDGTYATDIISPCIYARLAEKYGYIYKDVEQILGNGLIHIYPSEYFAGNKYEVTSSSYAVHMCAHSWHPTLKEKILKKISKIRQFFSII